MNTIVPLSVFDVPTGTSNTPYHLSSTGTLRYDIYPGKFYYDDVFAIAPFANTFVYVEGLGGGQVTNIMDSLLTNGIEIGDERTIPAASIFIDSLPRYVGGPDQVDEASTYDLFFNDYDQPYVIRAIAKELGVNEADLVVVGWRDDKEKDDYVDTTNCWGKKVGDLWPCQQAVEQ